MNKDKPARTLAEILDEHIQENIKKQIENTKVDYNSLTLWEKEKLFNLLYDKANTEYCYDWKSEIKFLPDCNHIYRMSDIEQMMDWVKDLEVIELHTLSDFKKYVNVKTIDWNEMFQYYLYSFKEGKLSLQSQSLKEYIKNILNSNCFDSNQREQIDQCIEIIDKLNFQ